MLKSKPFWLFSFVLAVATALATPTGAQQPSDGNPLGIGIDPIDSGGVDMPLVFADATFTPHAHGGVLRIAASIERDWHIYSITQQPGGPTRTSIQLAKSNDYKVKHDFVARMQPTVEKEKYNYAWPGLPVEEHAKEVVWEATLELADGVDPWSVKIAGKVVGQACHDKKGCVEFTADFQAKGAAAAPFQFGANHPKIAASVSPATVAPGEKAVLTISVEPAKTFYVYEYGRPSPDAIGSQPTYIAPLELSGLTWSEPTTDARLAPKPPAQQGDLPGPPHYEGSPTWKIELSVPADMKSGDYPISGILAYQTCREGLCMPLAGARFDGYVTVGEKSVAGSIPLSLSKAKYTDATVAVAAPPKLDLDNLHVEGQTGQQPFAIELGVAFLAGFILNFMPCVLPVLGLKVMSFVQQAGHSRRRTFMLNLWYTSGIMAVFLALGALVSGAGVNWGDQFQSNQFMIAMTALVFVFALSFLGIWEIPIPGFVGSGRANELAQQEGASGAFFKGVLTTLLATPCSGPLLGAAIAAALRRPPALAYGYFAFIGLGMASPYLVLGAFPKLVAFVPKPGAWMESFKHAMGFVMLGTVVFLLFVISGTDPTYVLPTFCFLISLWAACAYGGRLPQTVPLASRLRAWGVAVAFAAVVGLFSFGRLHESVQVQYDEAIDRAVQSASERLGVDAATQIAAHESSPYKLPWQRFSFDLLKKLSGEGRTVFVGFTSPSCATCWTNEGVALNQQTTKQFVDANNIATLKANVAHDPDASILLKRLGNVGGTLPYYVIFPANDPGNTITFDGLLTPSIVVDKLSQAIAVGAPSSNAQTSVDRPTGIR